MTNYLVPVTVNQLPAISELNGNQGMFILPDGSININRKNGTWMIINKQSDHAGVLKPADVPVIQPGDAKWFWAGAGTYPNAGGYTIEKQGILSYDGSEWKELELDIPQATQSIVPFSTSNFPLVAPVAPAPPIQRTHENSIWELKSGQTASSTDVPGLSDKWVSLGNSFDLDVEGGALSYTTFLELSKSSSVVGKIGSEAFSIVGGWGNDGVAEGYHYDWDGGRVTDYIPVEGGKELAITAVSNSTGDVPLFVVYNSAKTTILHKQYSTAINVPQTVSYITPANCHIIVNCALVAQLAHCKIVGVGSTLVLPSSILSDLNRSDFKNNLGGFLGYDEAAEMLNLYKKTLNPFNFDATMSGFTAARRMNANNVYENFHDASCRTLHNYILNGKKSLRFSGRLYDDRSTYIGLQGIKSDGTIVDIYARDGINSAWVEIVDKDFDISDFDKLSIAVDTSVYPFKGVFNDGFSANLGSTVLDDLKLGRTMKQRILSSDTPDKVKGLTGTRQEVNVIKFKGKTLMYYGKGWLDESIFVADYDISTNTASNSVEIINKTVTGVNSRTFKCPTAFVAEGKVYLVFSVSTSSVFCMMYESADGYNFTESSRTLANVSGFNSTLFGNHYIIPNKIDGFYYWFIEGTNPQGVWEMKLMKSQNITFGWSVVGTINGLSPTSGAKGGPCVFYHNGRFKMFYHYSPNNTNLPTWIAYAEADVNDPLNFTPYYMPLTGIKHKPFLQLTDQYADPEIHEIDGRTFMFCSIVDNTNGLSELWRWECEGRLYDILDSRI